MHQKMQVRWTFLLTSKWQTSIQKFLKIIFHSQPKKALASCHILSFSLSHTQQNQLMQSWCTHQHCRWWQNTLQSLLPPPKKKPYPQRENQKQQPHVSQRKFCHHHLSLSWSLTVNRHRIKASCSWKGERTWKRKKKTATQTHRKSQALAPPHSTQ